MRIAATATLMAVLWSSPAEALTPAHSHWMVKLTLDGKQIEGVPLVVQQQVTLSFLASIQSQRPDEEPEPEPGELSPRAVIVMNKAVSEADKSLMGIYSDLGLHPAEGKRALDELLARGFVRLHRLSRKGRHRKDRTIITHRAPAHIRAE